VGGRAQSSCALAVTAALTPYGRPAEALADCDAALRLKPGDRDIESLRSNAIKVRVVMTMMCYTPSFIGPCGDDDDDV
jgi:hypothetical protein